MHQQFLQDMANQNILLKKICKQAETFLHERPQRIVAPDFPPTVRQNLPEQGLGTEQVLSLFHKSYLPWMPASSGSRYFGYVIGGVTPAALAGDWYTSLFDQNAFGHPDSLDRHIEENAIDMLRALLDIPPAFFGIFVSGATTSAMTAMACARQWASLKQGKLASEEGLSNLVSPEVVSGLTHGANIKALSMVGLGRKITSLPCLPNREAIDVNALENYLADRSSERPLIVIANMGTAASGDLDDLNRIAELKDRYDFWLHVDGAFGALMACVPNKAPFFEGLKKADSITMDTHKWLNTPYDGAVLFCAHPLLQYQCFTNATQVPETLTDDFSFYHMTPEGSRRFRALPVWFSLMAYGKDGYREMCQRHLDLCVQYGKWVEDDPSFTLLNEVRSNVVCFTFLDKGLPAEQNAIEAVLRYLQQEGETYSNIAFFHGQPALRICLCNWQTTLPDIERAFHSLKRAVMTYLQKLN